MELEPDDTARRARFGEALAEALPRSRARTQKVLAAQLGVDQTMVSAWKHGRKLSRMSPGRVAKIERALGPDACPPGTLVAILFGPQAAAPAAHPPADLPQLEERLASIEAQLAAQGAAQRDQSAALAELLAAVREADLHLRDQGTS